MRGVKKLADRGTNDLPDEVPPALPPAPKSPPAKVALAAIPPTPSNLRPMLPQHSLMTPQLDHRRAPGLDKSTAGRFAKGMMEIDAVIDLHGLTQPVAHAALSRFIIGSNDLDRRCLLVITGKGNREGTGVLKAEVPRWLNEPNLRGRILAFTHAQPKDGGHGALYVLLKRRR